MKTLKARLANAVRFAEQGVRSDSRDAHATYLAFAMQVLGEHSGECERLRFLISMHLFDLAAIDPGGDWRKKRSELFKMMGTIDDTFKS